MEKLFKLTPHVLAAVNSQVDASKATAMGVIGSFEAFQRCFPNDLPNGVLVHGCGSVGSIVASELVKKGIKTFVVDLDIGRTKIPGTISLGNNKRWYKNKFDVIFPCSISGLINTEISQHILNSKAIISAANAPFSNNVISEKLMKSNIMIIPDPLVNAGAVIADSIEKYSPDAWSRTKPAEVYKFVQCQVRKKCFAYLSLIQSGLSSKEILELMHNEKSDIIGKLFIN